MIPGFLKISTVKEKVKILIEDSKRIDEEVAKVKKTFKIWKKKVIKWKKKLRVEEEVEQVSVNVTITCNEENKLIEKVENKIETIKEGQTD